MRSLIAWHFVNKCVYPVQVLDGVGAGLQSVAVTGLVARILDGTGRINAGQGAVTTMQGVGASLSPVLGGWVAEEIGYRGSFLVVGACAVASVFIWLGFGSLLRPACAGSRGRAAMPATMVIGPR